MPTHTNSTCVCKFISPGSTWFLPSLLLPGEHLPLHHSSASALKKNGAGGIRADRRIAIKQKPAIVCQILLRAHTAVRWCLNDDLGKKLVCLYVYKSLTWIFFFFTHTYTHVQNTEHCSKHSFHLVCFFSFLSYPYFHLLPLNFITLTLFHRKNVTASLCDNLSNLVLWLASNLDLKTQKCSALCSKHTIPDISFVHIRENVCFLH